MLTPEYLRNMCNRLRRIAQDMEDDLMAVIIAGMMAVADAASVETITEQLSQVVTFYQYTGVREIRRIFLEAVETSMATDAEIMQRQDIPADVVPEAPKEEPREPVPEPGEEPRQPQEMPPRPQETPQERAQVPEPEEIPPEEKEAQERPFEAPKGGVLDPYSRETMEHFYRTTANTWYNLTETAAYDAENEYVKAIDKAVVETATGQKSWSEARRDALDDLAERGIETVTSVNGRTEHTDTAAERNTRTAVARLAGDITLQTAIRNGFTLVLVSAHYGARPTHAVWQGKIYSINGDTSKYPDFWKETEYGQMLGLCGINCRHSFSPFAEGMRNPYEGTDYNDPERYNLEQEQRALEREIRALRRKKKELDAIYKAQPSEELKAERKALQIEIREAENEYAEFCAAHDLRPLWERTRV